MSALLRLDSVSAGYGSLTVLNQISLTLAPGQISCVLGRNGMGKSTLVRVITGALAPRAGRVEFAGRSIGGRPAHSIARDGIGWVPEGRQVFPNLTVAEHLTAFARPGPDGASRWSAARLFELFPRLAQRRANLGAQLSGGEQQMLAIARALSTNPRLLILDEATEGLAPLVREEIWRTLAVLRAERHAMLVIDKHVARLIELADQHFIVEKGAIVWSGSSAALDADRQAWQRWLGI